VSKPDTPPHFVHPSEQVFARILDFYGIPWEYEPRTFSLETDEAGNTTQAFTPDFYLPEQDLYVELTTLRPQLSSNKNRKLKRLQELYPDINIKLFKRRDLRNMMIKYGLMEDADAISGTDAQNNDLKDGERYGH
jgi:cation diffusion facilitator CzcD-associated flavoprotein CzcO